MHHPARSRSPAQGRISPGGSARLIMGDQEGQASVLRVRTLNLRNRTDRYAERRPLLEEVFRDRSEERADNARLCCDVLGMQEVVFENPNQLMELSPTKGCAPVIAVEARTQEPRIPAISGPDDEDYRIDGNGMLLQERPGLSFPSGHHEVLHMSTERCAHRVLLEFTGHRLWVVNTHLHHVEMEDEVRMGQAEKILDWCSDARMEEAGIGAWILIGDMNATPELSSTSTGETYALLRSRGQMSSVFVEVDGNEPPKTFPSGLQAPKSDTSCPEGICIDYIFFRNRPGAKTCLHARKCGIFAHEPSQTDKTLYPSDHIGVWAELLVGTPK